MHGSTILMNKDVHHGAFFTASKDKVVLCPGCSFPFVEVHFLQTQIPVTLLHFSPLCFFFFLTKLVLNLQAL